MGVARFEVSTDEDVPCIEEAEGSGSFFPSPTS